jgi:endoglucanase
MLKYRGVNLATSGFNSKGSHLWYDYGYDSNAHIDYFWGKGLNTFRIPVIEPRVFNAGDQVELKRMVNYITSKGGYVIIDMHGYGGAAGGLIGRDAAATAARVAFWEKMAPIFKDNTHVMYGLDNEPNKQTVHEWWSAVPALIAAVRKHAPNNTILVPGGAWDGAWKWVDSGNAKEAEKFAGQPGIVFDLHQYFDTWSTGTIPSVVTGCGASRLVQATTWARAHKAKLIVTEFGTAGDDVALKELTGFVQYMSANSDVWEGGTYWAGGTWWPADYFTRLTPLADKLDRPQMSVLRNFWK